MAEPICIDDIKELANLQGFAKDYVDSGAYDNLTYHENCTAFKRLRIRPRVLCGSRDPDVSVCLQGETIPLPIGISPTGHHSFVHTDGECATARGAHRMKACMCVSMFSSKNLSKVRNASPLCLLWRHFQVLVDKNKSIAMLREAEQLGCKAVVLTVDFAMPIVRRQFSASKYEFPEDDNEFSNELPKDKSTTLTQRLTFVKNKLVHMTWDTVDWLRSETKLPIILKGILTREDAIESLKHDIQGIIVSNHGGRQLDGVPATIEALPEVVEAIDGKIDVYFDGGIRSGLDVFKALALGAKAVFVGRPILWGLAYNGEEGVEKVLEILVRELKETMALSGCSSIKDIKKSMLVHESYYHKL